MGGSENSLAIDRAAAARSKSDEFSDPPILVIEIVSHLYLKPPKRCCTFWDPESAVDQIGAIGMSQASCELVPVSNHTVEQ